MSIKNLLKAFLLVTILCHSLASERGWAAELLPILQGPTSQTETQFSVVAPLHLDLNFAIFDSKGSPIGIPAKIVHAKNERLKVAVWHVYYGGLKPESEYSLSVMDGRSTKALDKRGFYTLPKKYGEKVTFIAVSCMDVNYLEQHKSAYDKINSLKPDFLIFLGDNIYATKKGDMRFELFGKTYNYPEYGYATHFKDYLWVKHLEQRTKMPLSYEKKLTPVYAIWDDHDFGMKDGDSSFPNKEVSLVVQNVFFPQAKTFRFKPHDGGVGGVLSFKGQTFVFLDNRWSRTKNGAKFIEQSHFPESQVDTLFKELEKDDQSVWIVSGGQIFGGYHKFESFQRDHEKAFREFTKQLIEKAKSLFVFLGGDRHKSFVSRVNKSSVGFETLEVISSPLHAKTYPGTLKKDEIKRIIKGFDASPNLTYIESNFTTDDKKSLILDLNIENYSSQGETTFTHKERIKRSQK